MSRLRRTRIGRRRCVRRTCTTWRTAACCCCTCRELGREVACDLMCMADTMADSDSVLERLSRCCGAARRRAAPDGRPRHHRLARRGPPALPAVPRPRRTAQHRGATDANSNACATQCTCSETRAVTPATAPTSTVSLSFGATQVPCSNSTYYYGGLGGAYHSGFTVTDDEYTIDVFVLLPLLPRTALEALRAHALCAAMDCVYCACYVCN